MERPSTKPSSSAVFRGNMERIINEIFKSEKAQNIFPDKTMTEENVCFTDVADEIKEIYEGHKSRTRDIKRVEERLLQSQIKTPKKEKTKSTAKSRTIPDSVNQKDIEKYHLIQKDEIFSAQRYQISGISLSEDDSYHTRGEEIRQLFMQQKLPILSPRKIADYILPEADCKCLDKVQVPEMYGESSTMTAKACDILRAYPPSVSFTNYVVGRLVEESIFIQNVSSRVVKFNVRPLRNSSRFKLSWVPLPGYIKMIAPGLRMKIKVAFQANCLSDEQDNLMVVADDGSVLTIALEAKRNPTLLKVVGTKPAAAPETADCGDCLLGNISTTSLQLCNCGRDAGFWINTEVVWPFWDSLDVSSKVELTICPFTISPRYFRVQHADIMKLNFTFKPTITGSQSQKVYILCDNCSVQELKITGNGLLFDALFLSMQEFEKNVHLDNSHDMVAQYRLTMPKCLIDKKASKLCTIINKSGLHLQYSWKKRNVNLISLPSDNLHGLQDTAVSIDPEAGTFKPHLEQDFLVECRATGLEVGMYKMVLQLHIENLPKDALPLQDDVDPFALLLDKFMPVKPVQLLAHEVELCMEVEPYRISMEPSIIELHGKISYTDKPIKRTVVVHNHGANSVMVEWQSSTSLKKDGLSCTLVMKPLKIQNCYPHSSFELTIRPAAPGKICEKLRLIIDNGAKILELMVKLEIYGQKISLSTNVLNFGLVKRGTFVKKKFRIINQSQIKSTWSLQEYFYNASKQMLQKESKKHVSKCCGYIDEKHEFNDVVYCLSTMVPGIWCSVLELRVNSSDQTEHIQEYILVIADIVTPKLMINVTASKDNTLQLFCPLYLGIECKRTLNLHNLTQLATYFSWAEPVGCDSHKLRVTFSPQEHIIPAGTSISVGITIFPLYKGTVRHFFVPCIVEKTNELLMLSIQVNVENVHVTFFIPSANSIDAKSEDTESNECFTQIPWPLTHEVPLGHKDSVDQQGLGLHYLDVCRCPVPTIPQNEALSMQGDTNQILKEADITHKNVYLGTSIFQCSKLFEADEPKHKDTKVIATSSLKPDSMEDMLADVKITQTEDGPLIYMPGVEGIPSTDFIPTFPLADIEQSKTEKKKGKKGDKGGKDEKKSKKATEQKEEDTKGAKKKKNAKGKDEDANKKKKGKKGTEKEAMDPDTEVEPEKNDADAVPDKEEDDTNLKDISDALLPVTSGIQYALPSEIIFSRLSCHKVFKKSFTVKNESPIATHFTVKVQNFAHEEEGFPEDRNANKDCHKTVDKLNTFIESGIIVAANPLSSDLLAYDAITVEVLIYATTWGSYTDYIHCKVSELPPFIIKLSIEVTGFPLFFPMAEECNGEGELRFGTMTWQGTQQLRRIRICNTSSINIFLTWHVFLVEENISNNSLQLFMDINNYPDLQQLPASDPHKIEEERMLMACFCNKCDDWRKSARIGMIPSNWKEDFKMLKIQPKDMRVPPGSNRFLTVQLDPCVTHDTIINAVAVGLIHLSIQDREQKDLYKRLIWPDLKPVVLKMSTTIENPLSKLHLLQGECQFQASAIDVLVAQSTHTIKQLLVLCYHGKGTTNVEVMASIPFHINKISTIDSNNQKTSCSNISEIVLTESMIIEIELHCILDLMHIQQAYMWLKQSKIYSEAQSSNSITLYRYLTFTPRNCPAQELQLQVIIYYPDIEVRPKTLDFGPVFLGATKGLSFTIENRSGFNIWVYLKKHCESCIFTVSPSPLYIPCTSVGDIGVSDVQVNFTPRTAISYQEVISVETLVPGDVHDILLMGFGTLNEKFNKYKQ